MTGLRHRLARLEALAAQQRSADDPADRAFIGRVLDLVPFDTELAMLAAAEWREAELAAGRSPTHEEWLARLPPEAGRQLAEAEKQVRAGQAREGAGRGSGASAP